MAIALGVSEHGENMTDEICRAMIAEKIGMEMKSTSGIQGYFYTANRERDIRKACLDILEERL